MPATFQKKKTGWFWSPVDRTTGNAARGNVRTSFGPYPTKQDAARAYLGKEPGSLEAKVSAFFEEGIDTGIEV